MEPESFNDHDAFDPDDFIRERYMDLTPNGRAVFVLRCYHDCFQTISSKLGLKEPSLKVLDYGAGPVLLNTISAAQYASEIVWADIAAPNREAVKKWLSKDLTAFNWSPHFDFTVQTLEGKGEKEAREREEMARKAAKGVVRCDIFENPPIEAGFEGPYDIIIEAMCLTAACVSIESYKEAIVTLRDMLKPGGSLLMWGSSFGLSGSYTSKYSVAGKKYNVFCVKFETREKALKEAGFEIVNVWHQVGEHLFLGAEVPTSAVGNTFFFAHVVKVATTSL